MQKQSTPKNQSGVVLLEVILALILFVGAATIISSALTASLASVDRMKYSVHAANLAVTLLSEMQMGILPMQSSAPATFESPFEAWIWEAQVSTDKTELETRVPLHEVEIIIRHESEPIVYRMKQFLLASTNQSSGLLEEEWETDESIADEMFLWP